MGNLQGPFENIKEQASDSSERNRIQSTKIGEEHHSVSRKQVASAQLLNPIIDKQNLHSTVALNPASQQAGPQRTEPEEEEPPSENKEQLVELNLKFYQRLALLDYQFREFPKEKGDDAYSNKNQTGLETVERQDRHGIKYIGQWKGGKLHGNGVLISNTSKYIGQFKNNLKHFHGREIFTNQVYEGEFYAGRRKGLGVRYTQTATQQGIFNNHLIFGIIKYENGNEYKGTLKNNKQHGEGLYFSEKDKNQKRIKEFFPDQFLQERVARYIKEHPDDGKGNVFIDAQTDTLYQNCKYDNGILKYAKITYSNGNTYKGELKKGRKHGKGTFNWKDGSSYEGDYVRDEKHGKGTLVIKNNGKLQEEFKDRDFVNGVMRQYEADPQAGDESSEMPPEWL